ncbi:MAG: hypothetical protein AB7O37_16075 [Vicinamibacteria bacterium]
MNSLSRRSAVPCLLALVLAACGGGAPAPAASPAPAQGGLGEQVGDAGADTRLMHEANAAAGSVVRAAGDCDAVKQALPDASVRLDEIAGKLRTATARTALESLRQQLRKVAEACP